MIKHEFVNPILKRTEVSFVMKHQTNPGMAEAAKAVATHYKVGEEVVVVKAVRSGYGKHEFTVEALVYKDAESKAHIEPKPKVKKEKSS